MDENTSPNIVNSTGSQSNLKITAIGVGIGLVIVTVLYFIIFGYLKILPFSFPVIFSPTAIKEPTQGVENQTETVKSSPLFSSQQGVIIGSIIKISGNGLTVQDKKLQADTFPVAIGFTVYNYKKGENEPETTKGFDAIKIGREGTILLQVNNGRYEAVAITYVAK